MLYGVVRLLGQISANRNSPSSPYNHHYTSKFLYPSLKVTQCYNKASRTSNSRISKLSFFNLKEPAQHSLRKTDLKGLNV